MNGDGNSEKGKPEAKKEYMKPELIKNEPLVDIDFPPGSGTGADLVPEGENDKPAEAMTAFQETAGIGSKTLIDEQKEELLEAYLIPQPATPFLVGKDPAEVVPQMYSSDDSSTVEIHNSPAAGPSEERVRKRVSHSIPKEFAPIESQERGIPTMFGTDPCFFEDIYFGGLKFPLDDTATIEGLLRQAKTIVENRDYVSREAEAIKSEYEKTIEAMLGYVGDKVRGLAGKRFDSVALVLAEEMSSFTDIHFSEIIEALSKYKPGEDPSVRRNIKAVHCIERYFMPPETLEQEFRGSTDLRDAYVNAVAEAARMLIE